MTESETSPLPTKLSALLRIGVGDAKKIEHTAGYELDMHRWHTPPDDEVKVCSVCMAGAVMVFRLNANAEKELHPSDFGGPEGHTYFALTAIDSMRVGNFGGACRRLRIDPTKAQQEALDLATSVIGRLYQYSGDETRASWEDYLEVATQLEAAGL